MVLVYTSPLRRAIETCVSIAKNYPNCEIELFKEIHEFGGCFLDNKGYPGMSNTDVCIFIFYFQK